ncbi:MAG TPA: glycosyltransferase [Candidatus Dormibacteraeota bacterium]|nr:glycosyltransferase [Candidatus Dormibacteraeota bacterium]
MNGPAPKPPAPLLSVVVPTRNEADNVEALLSRLAQVLKGFPTQVLFIDDSEDDTGTILDRLAEHPPGDLTLMVVHRPLERRTGLGSAAVEGFNLAQADVVAVMDGDLQHPPELLRQLTQRLQEDDLDIAVASRYARGGSPRGLNGPARRVASAVGRRLVQALFREARKTSDPLSGYFLCKRSAIEGIEFRPIGFKILLEILVCAPGVSVGDVPLKFERRHAGRSNASPAQGVAFLSHVWSLIVKVPGSARLWKFSVVGVFGLLVFTGLLLGGQALGLGAFRSWALAFTVSLAINWQINRTFTFVDVATPLTPGPSRPVYLPVAILGGCANLIVFTLLLGRYGVLPAGLGGAATAMLFNYLLHRRLLRRPPRLGSATGTGIVQQALLGRLGSLVPGEAQMLPSDADEEVLAAAFSHTEGPPLELLLAAARRRPIIIAEAPSHLAQPRRDVGLSAWMGVPVIEGRHYLGLLVIHRQGAPFSGEELTTLLRAVRSMSREVLPPLYPLLVPDIESGEAR